MKTIIKIALGIVLGCTLLVVGCGAVLGAGVEQVEQESKRLQAELDVSASQAEEAADTTEAAAAASVERRPRTFARGEASGDYAVASADGTIERPEAVRVTVKAVPAQPVAVSWMAVCSRGGGSGSKDGQRTIDAPGSIRVALPMDGVDDCIVSATAQLEGSGDVRVRIVG